jgi:hypothetical protein
VPPPPFVVARALHPIERDERGEEEWGQEEEGQDIVDIVTVDQ